MSGGQASLVFAHGDCFEIVFPNYPKEAFPQKAQ
jgi:hypothetical protein